MLADRIANFVRDRAARRFSARRNSSPRKTHRFVPGAEGAALESRALLTSVTVGPYTSFQWSVDDYLAFYNNGKVTEVNMYDYTTTTFNVGTSWSISFLSGDALVYVNSTSVTEVNLYNSTSKVYNVGNWTSYWQAGNQGDADGYLAFYTSGTLTDIDLYDETSKALTVGTSWTTTWQPNGTNLADSNPMVLFYGGGVVTEAYLANGGVLGTYSVGTGWSASWQVNDNNSLSWEFYSNGTLTQAALIAFQKYTFNVGSYSSTTLYNGTLDFWNGNTLTYVDLFKHALYSNNVGTYSASWQTYNGWAFYNSGTLTEVEIDVSTPYTFNIGSYTSESPLQYTLDFYNGNTVTVVNLDTQVYQAFNVGSYANSWQLAPSNGLLDGNSGFLAFYGGGNLTVINLASVSSQTYNVGNWSASWDVNNADSPGAFYLAFYGTGNLNGYLTEVDLAAGTSYTFGVGGYTSESQFVNSLVFVEGPAVTTVNLALHNEGFFNVNQFSTSWQLPWGYLAYYAGGTLTVIDLQAETSSTYSVGSYTAVWYDAYTIEFYNRNTGILTEVDAYAKTTTTVTVGSYASAVDNNGLITFMYSNGSVATLTTGNKDLQTWAAGSWNGFWELPGYILFYYQSTGVLTYNAIG
jgi:hypothetical protein